MMMVNYKITHKFSKGIGKMLIMCAMSQRVAYTDRDGTINVLYTRPGKHNYTQLDPQNDPVCAADLFTLRKHSKLTFDDYLPRDMELLKECPKDEDSVEFLAKKVLLKPSTVGRVNKKAKVGKVKKNVGSGNQKNDKPSKASSKSVDNSGEPGKLSGK